jgi:hypothetical protein
MTAGRRVGTLRVAFGPELVEGPSPTSKKRVEPTNRLVSVPALSGTVFSGIGYGPSTGSGPELLGANNICRDRFAMGQ